MTLLRHTARRRAIATTGVLLASALLLTGCSTAGGTKQQQDSAAKASDKNVPAMTIGMGGSVRSLDEAAAYDTTNYPVLNLLSEGLMHYDAAGALKPDLASKVETPNPLTYVYTLRSGLKFWNGDPVTAEDAAFSLKRNMDPKTASVLAGYYSSVKDIVASGPDQVTMTLKHVDPFAQYIPAFSGHVVEKKYVEAKGKAFGTGKGLTMGTGPYKVTSYSSAGLQLQRNDSYWGTKPKVQSLKFTQIENPDSLRLAMQSGDIDATFGASPETFNVWDKLQGVKMTYADAFYLQYLSLETTRDPFNDVHVRKAIAYAANAKGLLKPLFNGHAGLSKSPIIDSAWANFPGQASEIKSTYDSLPTYDFNLKKAKEELAQSSHPNGFTVTVPYPSTTTYLARTMENLKQNLAAIGITLNLQATTGEKWGGHIWANPPGIGMQIEQFGLDYPDPGNFPALALGKENSHPNSLGTARFSTPELEKFLAQQRSTTDPAKRVEALTGIVKITADQVPVIPLFHTFDALALSDKFVYDGTFSHWTYIYGDWAVNLKAAG
jgi:peptide/nickel transport system substrate-binding protein